MMVPLSLISGIWVGSQAVELLLLSSGADITTAELWSRWSLLCFIAAVGLYFWGAFHASHVSKISIKGILAGEVSIHFYAGVLLAGMIAPLIITLWVWATGVKSLGSGMLFLRLVCVVIGDLMMRYCMLRRGMYRPIVRHSVISQQS